jgi:hypothetical protein
MDNETDRLDSRARMQKTSDGTAPRKRESDTPTKGHHSICFLPLCCPNDPSICASMDLNGPEGVRTPDLMTASHARSQLRHRPVFLLSS